jgi:hypothetical protein
MSASPGRTYRYYRGTPLFSFGMGLSLTQFSLECTNKLVQGAKLVAPVPTNESLSPAGTALTKATATTSTNISVVCIVTNTGERSIWNAPALRPYSSQQKNQGEIVRLRTTGTRVGDEVVQVYHQVGSNLRATIMKQHPVPLRRLVEFERVTVCR